VKSTASNKSSTSNIVLRAELFEQLDYRRWAENCARQALDPRISGDEREYLLTKQRSLLMLAASEEWLGGDTAGRDQ
jgi:hypothetical protein